MTGLADIGRLAAPHGLSVMGGLHPDATMDALGDNQTLVLLGTGPAFWDVFQTSPEAKDSQSDPIDRWSVRVIGSIARTLSASVIFPFGPPPYAPFIDYALRSGWAWTSPVGMLVHRDAGLMISFRGALAFKSRLSLPADTSKTPCDTCADAPCRSACPVDALGPTGYDVAACHAFLDSEAGQDCMTQGCKARRACPVSQRFGRDPAQSAWHMKAFHP